MTRARFRARWRGAQICAAIVAASQVCAGCSQIAFKDGAAEHVAHVEPSNVEASTRLVAGVREIDITPPPGLPTYGYSMSGRTKAHGYWTRLKARIIVLQSGSVRTALVQLDLGASSDLLHRRLAARLASSGIGPDRLLMATTHTHGGPGGFFGVKFYNQWVAARPAYDPVLVQWLVDRIGGGIESAAADLRPARLGVAEARVASSAASNRSRVAWLQNFEDGSRAVDTLGQVKDVDEVDRTLTLLRIDLEDESGQPRPSAVWTVYPVHGTSMPPSYDLHHGDVHGLAARLIARTIERDRGVSNFVAATATGAEGDVGPGIAPGTNQGKTLTMHVATELARAALMAFRSLDGAMLDPESANVPITIAYTETSMRGAGTTRGRLCASAFLGAPQLRGSEEGRGLPAGIFDADEGSVRPPGECAATKVRFAGAIQSVIIDPDDFPDIVPFQVVAFGRPGDGPHSVLFATMPGEPTTELGRIIESRVADASGFRRVTVLGLTNGYATYFTTGPEYLAQHYEGGATIYGGHQGTFAVEQLEKLGALATQTGAIHDRGWIERRTFRPGEVIPLMPRGPRCRPSTWTAGELEREVLETETGTSTILHFSWNGADANEVCDLPRVHIECGGELLRDERSYPQNDDGFSFEVRRECDDEWRASWTERGKSDDACSFVVERPGSPPLRSRAFEIGKAL